MKTGNARRQKTKSPGRAENGAARHAEERLLQRVPNSGELALPANRAEAIALATQMIAEATGVKDLNLSARIIDQVSRSQAVWPFGDTSKAIEAASEMMFEIKPGSLTEALLAAQMIGVHHAALSCLLRTALQVKSLEDLDAAARVTERLMRLYIEQMEAMAKLKGKIVQQEVTVGRVHVHEGGQAIVGAVRVPAKAEGDVVMRKSERKAQVDRRRLLQNGNPPGSSESRSMGDTAELSNAGFERVSDRNRKSTKSEKHDARSTGGVRPAASYSQNKTGP